MTALDAFHPAVRRWFAGRFPDGPTTPQAEGWPAIASGEDTLIAAPTGSGKTLAAFLVAIDRLLREAEAAGGLPDATTVVYVSPLKALAADVRENLRRPLAEIATVAAELGRPLPQLRVLARTGDTPGPARAAMLRRPPHLVVTTPESLYLLVTAARSRERLRAVRTVIVDEIHAVARDKRGAHLALTLERLEALATRRPQRIGLSATQRPVATMGRLLVGAGEDRSDPRGGPACRVIDLGHRRPLDLGIELPGSELGAVASREQWGEILDRIAARVRACRTTLVFVNTRRLAERVAHLLGERLGADRVAAHHGSLSRERRQRLEARLRAGELAALVATASLELGLDVGPVELVCQIGRRGAWPRSSSASAAPVTGGTRPPSVASTRPAATSWSRRPRSCAGCAPGGSTPSTHPGRRSTSSPSRWSPPARRSHGGRATCSVWSGAPRPTRTSTRGTSRRCSSCSPGASRPGAAGGRLTSTGTACTACCVPAAARAWRR